MNPATEPFETDADDPRLFQAVQEYQRELEAGRRPERRAFAARFPDLAEALAPYLDALDMVHAAAELLPCPSGNRSTPVTAEIPPEPLGDFHIVREIGRGGMGIVYEAVQRSLGRRVALKVLPFAAALDARQLQRFKNEAQAAAHLHHSNIVPVYAVGSERGVHYYAMQLIQGQNLAALVQELRRGSVPSTIDYHSNSELGTRNSERKTSSALRVPRSELGQTRTNLGSQLSTQWSNRARDFFRTIARLTAQAAEALDYAHGMGIVHRDVKPANLLVDHSGNVWVTDFGLAQFHADASLTQTGDLLGTVRYMSPEQAGGQSVLIDHRTDVYSLGATLYELLTLRPIFDGANRQLLLNQILHEEPMAPRAVDRAIPPELETVVLKAVAKVPAERYSTAGELADDLHRFLRHEPIQARRPTVVQRVRKWFRRHPGILVAGAVLLMLVAAGSLFSAGLVQRAYDRERQRAEEAEDQFRLARQSVDRMIQLAERELGDHPNLRGLRKQILEDALVYYQKFTERSRDDPRMQKDLSATRERVQKILADLAVLQGAWRFSLLREPAVLDDLGLSEEQRQDLKELSDGLDKKFKDLHHRLAPEEQKPRFLALARANEAAFNDILSPEQGRRLWQIALQRQGPSAFREAEIVTELNLTASQRERIRVIEAGVFPPGGPGGFPMKREEAMKKAMQQITGTEGGVLTPEQRTRWQAMTGKPFKAAFAFPWAGPPGPPRPPGPHGPQRQGDKKPKKGDPPPREFRPDRP